MISYEDIPDLEGEVEEQVREIIDRRQELGDMPLSLSRVEAFEQLYQDAESLGLPHFMATARYEQFNTLSDGAMPEEAAEYYLMLLDVLERYGQYVHPSNRASFYRSAPWFIDALMRTPEVPLDTIRGLLARVEGQASADVGSPADTLLARAMVASRLGHEAETLDLLDRWAAVEDPEWSPHDDGTVRVEIGVLEGVSLAAALESQRERTADLYLRDADARAYHAFVLASLLSQAGEVDEARRVIADIGPEAGADADVPTDDHLRALEPFPAHAAAEARRMLAAFDLTSPGEYTAVAAIARTLLLADPDDADGLDLMRIAETNAARLDARNGTDAQRRILAERWWTGLPPAPSPAPEDELAGIAERVILNTIDTVVDFADAPYLLRDDYTALTSFTDIYSAPDAETAARLAAEIEAESQRLRFPTGVGFARWSLCIYHFTDGDRRVAFRMFPEVQDFIVENAAVLSPLLLDSFATAFALLFDEVLTSPEVSLAELRSMIENQQRFADENRQPSYPAAVARAILAAHLGDVEDLEELQFRAMQLGHAQDSPVGAVELTMVLTTARISPDAASQLLAALPDDVTSADEEKARNFAVLGAYLDWRTAGRAASDGWVDAVLDSVDGDLEEINSNTPLAYFIAALDGSARFDGLLEPLEETARRALPHSWESLAALGGVLLRRDPADARGQALLDEARAHAAALDRRNATTSATEQMERLWL